MRPLLAAGLILIPPAVSGTTLEHVFDGARLPSEQTIPWHSREQPRTSVSVTNGALRVADDGTAGGQLQFISRPWSADADAEARVEAEVRVVRCTGPSGVTLLAANGRNEAALTLYPDRIELHRLGATAPVRLDDAFHRVSMVLRGRDLRVSVDGKALFDLAGKWEWPAAEGRNIVGFGSISSAATGEAWWKSIRASTDYPDAAPWPGAEDIVVYREPDVYACFPSLATTPQGWFQTHFGTRTRRSHIDPTGGSTSMISKDDGRTWEKAPATISAIHPEMLRADGHLAVAGATGWQHVPEARRAELEARGLEVRPSKPGHVAFASGARFRIGSTNDAPAPQGWTPIDMPPHRLVMGYNQSAYLNLGAGVRLVAIYGETPDRRRDAYVLRTTDDGNSWRCITLATGAVDLGFNEPALGTNAAGHVIALLRTAETPRDRGFLYQSASSDKGMSWSAPVNTGMWGYPANLLTLSDGRIVASYGYRKAPMGVRATLSNDGGKSWDTAHTIVLRADGQGNGSDLGYPISRRLDDGSIFTLYYFNGRENITHIAATRWRPPPR